VQSDVSFCLAGASVFCQNSPPSLLSFVFSRIICALPPLPRFIRLCFFFLAADDRNLDLLFPFLFFDSIAFLDVRFPGAHNIPFFFFLGIFLLLFERPPRRPIDCIAFILSDLCRPCLLALLFSLQTFRSSGRAAALFRYLPSLFYHKMRFEHTLLFRFQFFVHVVYPVFVVSSQIRSLRFI